MVFRVQAAFCRESCRIKVQAAFPAGRRCIGKVCMALRRHTHALDGRPRPSSRKKYRLLWEHVQRPTSSLHLHWGKMQAAFTIDRHRVSKVRKAWRRANRTPCPTIFPTIKKQPALQNTKVQAAFQYHATTASMPTPAPQRPPNRSPAIPGRSAFRPKTTPRTKPPAPN